MAKIISIFAPGKSDALERALSQLLNVTLCPSHRAVKDPDSDTCAFISIILIVGLCEQPATEEVAIAAVPVYAFVVEQHHETTVSRILDAFRALIHADESRRFPYPRPQPVQDQPGVHRSVELDLFFHRTPPRHLM